MSDIIMPLPLKDMMLEAFCFPVCPFVSESVHPENIVNKISQKLMKGISVSPNFGRKCTWICGCAS